MMTDTLYIRIRIESGQFRWFAFTVRDRKAVLKEYRIMRHAGKARRSIARMHVVCLLFATVGGDQLPADATARREKVVHDAHLAYLFAEINPALHTEAQISQNNAERNAELQRTLDRWSLA